MVTLVLTAAVTLMAVSAVACVPPPYCGIEWGSGDKTDPAFTQAPVVDARGGQQECFDRLVIDLGAGPTTGWFVRYVPEVIEDGSGEPVPLRGGAFLQISVHAPAHDDLGNPTYNPPNDDEAVDVTGFQTFRQVAFVSDFEGITTFGLGVRARLPFRAFVLPGPGAGSRLVVDVGHQWCAPGEARC